MKKKVIITMITVVLGIGIIGGVCYKKIINDRNHVHYVKIKENIRTDVNAYVTLTNFNCDPNRGGTIVYTEETLINQRGMDKELLLDVDGKSYCNVKVEVKCLSRNVLAWDTYLKCKDYEDLNYDNLNV